MRKKKKVNANETYMQTVMRRFRAHHLAKISLVIPVSYTHLTLPTT